MLKKLILLLFFCSSFSPAQYHYFGRNKVQYVYFNWQVVETPHFEIYYYPEIKEIANWATKIAEDTYREYQSRFDFYLNRKVPLILYSTHLHFQQTNVTPWIISEGVGGFFEFIKGRVVLPYDGAFSKFKHVLRHELVHVFMTAKINREYKDHGITNPVPPPLWFTEGLAEFWSTEIPDQDAFMVLKDAVLNNQLVPVNHLNLINGTFLMYKEGEDFLSFLARRYGKETILLLLKNIWRSSRFEDVITFVYGKPLKELSSEWEYDLKQRVLATIEKEVVPFSRDEKVTTTGFNSKPVFYRTAEGDSTLIFVSNRTGYTNIYQKFINREEKSLVSLIKGEKTSEFESFHFFRSGMDINQKGWLVFVTKSGATDIIHVYDVERRKMLYQLKFPGITGISSPAWDQSGRRIVFSGLRFNGLADLYIYNFQDSTLQEVTTDFYDDRDAIWFNQDTLIFSSDRGSGGIKGRYHLFLLELKRGAITQITKGEFNCTLPALSRDGKWLAFCCDYRSLNNIMFIKVNELRRGIIDTVYTAGYYSSSIFEPEWIGERSLFYTTYEKGYFNIYRLNLSNHLEVTSLHFTAQPWAPVWKPEGYFASIEEKTRRYRGKYSLDIAQGQVVQDPIFGTAGGANIVLSDVMGDRRYYILIYNNARVRSEFMRSFNFMVTRYSYARRTNWGVALFRFSQTRFNYYDGFYDEDLRGALFQIQYPLSKFNRLEGFTGLAISRKEWYDFRGKRKAWMLQNFFSYIHDNSIWSLTGPIDGSRFLITAGYNTDIRYSNVNYYTLIGDYRLYLRTGLRSAYAIRIMGLISRGKEARRFYIGGSWTLRGYPLFGIWGNHSILVNNEYRFPLINNILISLPRGNISLGSFNGSIFLDFGNAWEEAFPGLLGSLGITIKWNLGGALVLRYDIGRRTDFKHLDKHTFFKLFFGWDY